MDEARIKEVFADEAFVKSLVELETSEAVQAALKEKGVDVTLEDVNKLRDSINTMKDSGEELSLDALEGVAGGSVTVALIAGGAAVISALIPSLFTLRW